MVRMRKSRLSQSKQTRLQEHFVAGTTARCATSLVGVNFINLRSSLENKSRRTQYFPTPTRRYHAKLFQASLDDLINALSRYGTGKPMIPRLFLVTILITVLSACAQTRPSTSLNKHEKSVEFVEMIFTDKFIKEALLESFLQYKAENEVAAVRLPDKALEEINTLITAEMIKNRTSLINKIAAIFTTEFTNDEIIALHSIKDIELLQKAHAKLSKNKGPAGLTRQEIDALASIKNPESFITAIPKLERLERRIEATGEEFAAEILPNILPRLLIILEENEPLLGAFLFTTKPVLNSQNHSWQLTYL